MYPREPGVSLQKWAHTQVAVGARVAYYHDEVKVSLPAIWTPLHHLLFTFFHVDLQTKLEAPKPVSYACIILLKDPSCYIIPYTLIFTIIFLFEMIWGFVNLPVFSIGVIILFICLTGSYWICRTSIVYSCSVCIFLIFDLSSFFV